MTVKDFCRKYEVDYNTVYGASALVDRDYMKAGVRYDYDEDALRRAVLKEAERRVENCRRALAKAEDIVRRCEKPVAG